jgi:hypothetical protein
MGEPLHRSAAEFAIGVKLAVPHQRPGLPVPNFVVIRAQFDGFGKVRRGFGEQAVLRVGGAAGPSGCGFQCSQRGQVPFPPFGRFGSSAGCLIESPQSLGILDQSR